MPNLFIIGNGFDIAHGLKTNYYDFRNFLVDEYKICPDEWTSLAYELYKNNNDISQLNDKLIVNFIINSLDRPWDNCYKWSDFEKDLSYLSYRCLNDYLYWQNTIHNNRRNDKHYDEFYLTNESYSNSIISSVTKLKIFFEEWISRIECSPVNVNNKFQKIINPSDDLFLSFNYTHILERIYSCKTVCHIHGDSQGTILVGHGETKQWSQWNISTKIDRSCPGIGENISKLWEIMKKNTELAINKASWFFDLFKMVNDIYSIGFSYSDVDLNYIQRICEILYSSTSFWNIESFPGKKTTQEYKQKIKNCGFKGRFAEFTI